MRTVIFATENPGKLREVQMLADGYGVTVKSPSQAGFEPVSVQETGSSYEENAVLKVQAYLNQERASEYIICGDDSGIEIRTLGGEPGIHSRRWLGYDMMDQEIACYALGRMHDKTERTAVFRSVLAYSDGGAPVHYLHGEMSGVITKAAFTDAKRQEGFPFRRLFLVDGNPPIPLWRFDELPLAERTPSHREQSFIQLFEYLQRSVYSHPNTK